jgi:DNA-binding GntR family transcriptional regulator
MSKMNMEIDLAMPSRTAPRDGNAAKAVQRAPRRRVSAQDVADQVLALVASRELQPGDRLREQDLADRFSVSRGPVREALRILEARSIVHIEPMRGATITRLTDEEARESVAVSAVLFGLSASMAAARATPVDIATMRTALARLEAMVESDHTPAEFYEGTLVIARTIMRVASTERLMRLIVEVRFGAPSFFAPLGYTTTALRRESAATWLRLIDAIAAGDAATADAMSRKVHEDAMTAALGMVG